MVAIDLEEMLKSAATSVFNTMLNLQVVFDKLENNFFNGDAHVAGAVGFTGNFNGVVYLYSSTQFARKMTCTLLGLAPHEIEGEEMVNDAMGELSNMVAGHIKSRLCDRGKSCVMTIPTVVRGHDFSIEPVHGAERRSVFFMCEGGRVLIEVLIKDSEVK
jgi:chemotaxis protein CheX